MTTHDWQPIATMPTNRTPVLLFSPDGHIGIGYLEEQSEWSASPYGSAVWSGVNYGEKPSVWLGGVEPEDATHWMPLPPAPVQP